MRRIAQAVAVTGILWAAQAGPALAAEHYPGGTDNTGAPGVLSTGAERASTPDTPRRGPEVLGAQQVRGSNLAVTGGDVVGLSLIAVSLVGGGVVLVRRSRRSSAVAGA